MKNKIIELSLFVIFLSLTFFSNVVTEELRNALEVFFYVLFPSIFPFFLISDLLIEYNFVHTINKIFKGLVEKIFHVGGAASFIIIMSMTSGFPSGAKYIKSLYEKDMITLEEANYLISFTHFANPLFVLTVTKTIFNDTTTSVIILIAMYLANFLIGFIIRPKKLQNKRNLEQSTIPNFSISLTNSIKSSIDLLVLILGNTCFFFLITKLISTYFDFNSYITCIINGFFDMTKGIQSISILPCSILFKSILVITFICFGGINVNMQVASIISDTNIEYKNFLLGRICQIALATGITYFLSIIVS